jgi:hypothetical protein
LQDELKLGLEQLHYVMRVGPRESLQESPRELPQQPTQESTQEIAQESAQEPTPKPTQEPPQEPPRELGQQLAQEPVRQLTQELLQGQTQRNFKSRFEMAGLLRSRQQSQTHIDWQEQLSVNKILLATEIERLQQALAKFLATKRIPLSPLSLAIAVLAFYVLAQLGNVPLRLWQIIVQLWPQTLRLSLVDYSEAVGTGVV